VVQKQNDTTVINKNVIDISNDSLIYDKHYDNPISFAKKVIARTSSPSAFKGKQLYYGQFITQLYNDGNIDGKPNMWDLALAARSRVGGESLGKIKIFVCIVFIPELQFLPFPLKDDWEAIEQIALNGGMFKSYTYLLNGGAIPQYNDTVLVSFGDPNNRTEGWFEYPEVEGAAPGAGSGGGSFGQYHGGGSQGFLCKASEPKTPKPKQSKNTKTTAASQAVLPANKKEKNVTDKPKKPSKQAVESQTPAKKTSPQTPCPAPFGAISGPLAWVRISGGTRVHLRAFTGKGIQYGTAKMQAWLRGMNSIPGGLRVSDMPGLSNLASGWRVGEVSRINPGPWHGTKHKTHQSGIDCDISIPKINGGMSIAASSRQPGGWGFSRIKASQLDMESCLLFLRYTMNHAKQIIWDPDHIEAAKAAAQFKVNSQQQGWTQAIWNKLFKGRGHVVRWLSGHANHFHVQIKGPGLNDRRGNGQADG